MSEEAAALYVVPTPLGHLDDITLRALTVLRRVPWVAAEDTRHSAPLLRHYGSSARLLASHQHNEAHAADEIVARLDAGESVALIVDAGTPAVSDPGVRVVARARAAGHRVVPLPGACAAIVALSAAGFGDGRFLFYGFLPARSGQRAEVLRRLASLPWTLIFYEAPHRIVDTVEALAAVFGPARTILLARELSKLFEDLHCCSLAEAADWLRADANHQRGEFVLVVSGAPAQRDEAEGERVLQRLLDDGLSVSQASRLAHAITGASKNALYQRALQSQAGASTAPAERQGRKIL